MMPALLCLLLFANTPGVDVAPVDELEEAPAVPLGLFTGPAAAVATVAPVMTALVVLAAACPLTVAGCALLACRTPREVAYAGAMYGLAGTFLTAVMACGPLLGAAAVVTDAVGFLAGQEARPLRSGNGRGAGSAGRAPSRRTRRALHADSPRPSRAVPTNIRFRDGVIALAVAAPALVGVTLAQVCIPIACLGPSVGSMFGFTAMAPLVVLPPLILVGSGAWWLFSVTLLRPLLLLALDSQR